MFFGRTPQHARAWLAAIAATDGMRTVVTRVKPRVLYCQQFIETSLYCGKTRRITLRQGQPALVGDQHRPQADSVQSGDRSGRARKHHQIGGGHHVFPVGGFDVECPIPVEKDSTDELQGGYRHLSRPGE